MRAFISEDDIEQSICNRLTQSAYGWKRIECDPAIEAQDDVTDSESRPAFKLKWLVRINNRAIWEPNDASILSTAGIIEEEYTK